MKKFILYLIDKCIKNVKDEDKLWIATQLIGAGAEVIDKDTKEGLALILCLKDWTNYCDTLSGNSNKIQQPQFADTISNINNNQATK